MERRKGTMLEIACGVHAESRTRSGGYMMSGHHCHTHFELFYVEEGACRLLIENGLRDLRAGDFMLIPPYSLHYTRYLFGACRRSVIFFSKEDLAAEIVDRMPEKAAFFTEARFFQTPPDARERINAHVGRMAGEDKLRDGSSPLLLRLQLQELLLYCGRFCAFSQDGPERIDTTDPQILLAARYIKAHYMDNISAADIAAAAGFSPNYLSRRFRQAAGIGPHEYLVFVRLQRAAQELLSTDASITEIAFRCGFSDSNYFKDAFKRKYGITPRAYRNIS